MPTAFVVNERVPSFRNDFLGRLRKQPVATVAGCPAQALDRPPAEREQDQPGDEKEEDETPLHGFNLRRRPETDIGHGDDSGSPHGMRRGKGQTAVGATPLSTSAITSRNSTVGATP